MNKTNGGVLGGCLVVLAILAVICLMGGCTVVAAYNGVVGKSQNVDSKWSQVQNVYQRRLDLIPNLVATVQGAATFEKSTFVEIAQARASVGQMKIDASKAPDTAAQLQQFQQAQGQLGQALSRLMVVQENYPQLKTNQNFLELQSQLEGTENRIAVSRRDFNEAAQDYNTTIRSFPMNMVANMFGFNPKPYFEATANAQNAPAVKF